jgi:AcrR family transcriptional regulator
MEGRSAAATDRSAGTAAPRGAGRKVTYARGDAARRRILDVAWEAFAERGFRGTSFNEIAKAAGLTMAGLIHHFPTKVDLFTAVLAARDADDHARLHGLLGDEPTGFEVLDAFVATARMNADRYSLVQLSHLIAAESARGDHPGTEFAREHFRSTRDLVQKALQRSIDAGEIGARTRPDLVALQVVAMIEGLENQWLHYRDGIDLAGVFGAWVSDLKDQLRST